MANIKSQKKRILTNEKARQRNASVRSRVKTVTKKALAAIESKDPEQAQQTLPDAISAIDRAISKGVIHRKAGARQKSRLQRGTAAL